MIELFVNFRHTPLKLICLVMISVVCASDQRASAWMRLIPSLTAPGQDLIPPAAELMT
jgi:hypothetical protein